MLTNIVFYIDKHSDNVAAWAIQTDFARPKHTRVQGQLQHMRKGVSVLCCKTVKQDMCHVLVLRLIEARAEFERSAVVALFSIHLGLPHHLCVGGLTCYAGFAR